MTFRYALKKYRQFDLVIGGRGHAQMIPFGLGVPILSLDVHDKLGFFLEDIDRPEWLLTLTGSSNDISERAVSKAKRILGQKAEIQQDIRSIQSKLRDVTDRNIDSIFADFQERAKNHT
jgi:polysaccharide pyruvyl transferase WcaK-like protein